MQIEEAKKRIHDLENEREGLKKEVHVLNGDVTSLVKHVNDKELACTCGEKETDDLRDDTIDKHAASNIVLAD